jgi:predicted GTPase
LEVTKPMARKRIRHWIRRFVATVVENNRGRWRWTIDKLLDALVAAVVEEVLSALLKHLLT